MSGSGVTILDRRTQEELLRNVTLSSANGSGATWLAWPMPVLAALLVFFVILSCAGTFVIAVKIYRIKYLQVRCHLCQLKVPADTWVDGSHRRECSSTNRAMLSDLPCPFDVRCPKCLAYLKLMPKNFGTTFVCDETDCPVSGVRLKNNGFNRLSCFVCDYDLCDSCVHRRLFVLTKFSKHLNKETADSCSLCQPSCTDLQELQLSPETPAVIPNRCHHVTPLSSTEAVTDSYSSNKQYSGWQALLATYV